MYNLRSSQRKNKCIDNGCYLQNYLRHASLDNLNPKVRLERLKFLDDADIHNSRFYFKKDKKIIVKQGTPKVSNKTCFLIGFFSFIFLVLCLFFYKDKMQFYSIRVIKKFPEVPPFVKTYYFQTIKFYKSYMKLPPHTEPEVIFQTTKSDKAVLKTDSVVDSRIDDFEIRKLVRDNYKELERMIKFKNTNITSQSFIEEQCKIDLKSNSTMFDDSNLTDYALESLGAEIVTVFDTAPYGPQAIKFLNFNLWSSFLNDIFLMKYSKYFNMNGPNSILVPWRKPGDCWAFKGSRGRVQIKLSEKIFITAVTIDHIPKDIGGNIESAPKKFSVLGVLEPESPVAKSYLGTFEYSITGLSSQTFFMQPEPKTPFRWIEVNIESNYGKNYTCVYKIRVHGHK